MIVVAPIPVGFDAICLVKAIENVTKVSTQNKKIKIETQLKSLKTRSQEVFKLSIFKYISKSEFCLKVKTDFPSRHVIIHSGNKLISKSKTSRLSAPMASVITRMSLQQNNRSPVKIKAKIKRSTKPKRNGSCNHNLNMTSYSTNPGDSTAGTATVETTIVISTCYYK